MVIYTNHFVQDGFAATTRGPFIFIRPEYQQDIGLLEHERVHVRQWLRTIGLHSLLYMISKTYRLSSEVEAYREQAKHYQNDRRALFAEFLAANYDLDITPETALNYLCAK